MYIIYYFLCYTKINYCFDGTLCRLEESTGLAFRFVIGKTRDKSKMAELRKEVEEYDDFLLLDIEEEYSKLPYKTLVLMEFVNKQIVLTVWNWF